MLIYTLNMIDPSDFLLVNRDILFVPSETHGHEFVELEYILSGTGVQIINGKKYSVKRGDMIFIDVGEKHSYYSTNRIVVVNLIIHPALFEIIKKTLNSIFFDSLCRIPEFLRVSAEDFMAIETLILAIEQEFLNKDRGYRQILNNFLTNLFVDIFRKSQQQNDNNDSDIKNKIKEYVDEHYVTLTLPEIAEAFNYSPSYFSKYYKKIMGLTLTEYIHRKKINMAIKKLSDTELSIEKIMSDLGYSDKKNFYNVFKIQTGATPNEIRKSIVRQRQSIKK